MLPEPTRAEVVERFKEAGLKVTPQRLAIYRALARMKDHPSPDALFRSVRGAMPSLSLGTVYKTLDALQAAGLVEEISRLGETKRYDANLAPHDHLVCTVCRRIADIHVDKKSVRPSADGIDGFEVTEMHVQFFGVCRDCRKKR
ncbi:MAG: Fur family transcriptional regulator [Myxococcota bacterium]